MFERRREGIVIIFSGTHKLGQSVKNTIVDGDQVVLKIENESVLVRDIRKVGPSRYKGVIYGFDPSLSVELKGLNLGDEVEFDEQNIFSCSGK